MKIKFGTDGWRGIIAYDFTSDNLNLVALGLARYIKTQNPEPVVVVGHDTRFLSEEYADLVTDVLGSQGIHVKRLAGFSPTPLVAFAVVENKADGGVMITASHNPYYYNGIKFIPSYGGPADAEVTAAIEAEIEKLSCIKEGELGFARCPMSLLEIDVLPRYLEHVFQILDVATISRSRFRVIVDVMHGASARAVREALMSLSHPFELLREDRNAYFEGGLPDPALPNLGLLCSTLKEDGFDIGFALDGDGDRFAVVDSSGRYFYPNELISMVLYYLAGFKGKRGKVARTVATTHLIDDIAADFGLPVVETAVGFKHICREMLKGDVLIGGEESGGLSVAGHIPEKDGILAILLVLELCEALEKLPSEIMQEITSRYGRRLFKRLDLGFLVTDQKLFYSNILSKCSRRVGAFNVKDVSRLDGIKLRFENGDWMLVRCSGTEPLVRVYLESTDEDRLGKLESLSVQVVGDALK